VLRFQSLEVLLQWFVSYLLVAYLFIFFFFFFVIMRSLFLRYKKPHAALAMERTKPINQKYIRKESQGTNLNIHYREGFPCAGPLATYTRKDTN